MGSASPGEEPARQRPVLETQRRGGGGEGRCGVVDVVCGGRCRGVRCCTTTESCVGVGVGARAWVCKRLGALVRQVENGPLRAAGLGNERRFQLSGRCLQWHWDCGRAHEVEVEVEDGVGSQAQAQAQCRRRRRRPAGGGSRQVAAGGESAWTRGPEVGGRAQDWAWDGAPERASLGTRRDGTVPDPGQPMGGEGCADRSRLETTLRDGAI